MEKGYRIKKTYEGIMYLGGTMEYFVVIEFSDEVDEMRYVLEY